MAITRYCLKRDNGDPYGVGTDPDILAFTYPGCAIYEVQLEECEPEDADLVGFRWLNENYGEIGSISLIYPSMVQLDLAFGGSVAPSVEKGLGEVVYLHVTE